jgi:hypothetical protein
MSRDLLFLFNFLYHFFPGFQVSTSGSRKLTEMEKYILQKRFKEYFTQKRGNSSMHRSDL